MLFNMHILCVYDCLAFCTALPPLTYGIVMLGLCKWQLTSWVRVNAPVHSVAIVKGENKWSTTSTTCICFRKCAFISENVIRKINQTTGWLLSQFLSYIWTLFNMHILCVYQALFSDLSNRLENKTNYTQNVRSHPQCIILLSLSGFLHSTASFDMWHALWYFDYVNHNLPPT